MNLNNLRDYQDPEFCKDIIQNNDKNIKKYS